MIRIVACVACWRRFVARWRVVAVWMRFFKGVSGRDREGG